MPAEAKMTMLCWRFHVQWATFKSHQNTYKHSCLANVILTNDCPAFPVFRGAMQVACPKPESTL